MQTVFGIPYESPTQCPYCGGSNPAFMFTGGIKMAVRCNECKKDDKMSHYTSYTPGDITYNDAGNTKKISKGALEKIKSCVTTHEGEFLQGKSAQRYMDRYSKQYLGKDLSGSYKRREVV